MVAIADCFTALTADKPWRKRYGIFQALVVMRDQMEGAFDRQLLKVFVGELGRLLARG